MRRGKLGVFPTRRRANRKQSFVRVVVKASLRGGSERKFHRRAPQFLPRAPGNFSPEQHGDFSVRSEDVPSIIFFLTSLFNDSIHSISRNKRSLQQSMKNGREN